METRNFRLAAGTSYMTFLWYRSAAQLGYAYTNSSSIADYFWPAFTWLLILPSIVLITAEIGHWISERNKRRIDLRSAGMKD